MKVCLIVFVILLAAGLLWQVTAGRGARQSTVGAIAGASMAVIPLTLPAAAIAALAAQALQNLGGVPLAEQFAGMAQSGVFAMMAGLLLGAVAGIVSLVRRQGVWFPLCGAVTSVALLALFAYFRFHASGFDQDRWVPTMAGKAASLAALADRA